MSQLVDLGASNRLLYYRTLNVGTLDLDGAAVPAIESLRQGARVSLSDLFPDPELRIDAARRVRAVNAKAVENLEERGLRTLYLAWGMATWTPVGTAATPAAPVLLFPLRAARKGTAGEEFEFSVVGEPQLNPTLIQLLQSRHGLTVAADDIVDHATPDGSIEPDAMLIFNEMTHICAPLAGFAIAARNVIGNFSFAKLPMVNDLNANRDQCADHDLIASIAGDVGARKQLAERATTVPDDLPDVIAPDDEHLVLPADASQSHVINRVLNGESITIQGPPGTGKSQTIANLIASLVAEDKRVLFVAEKRAAIDAVVKRLHQVGLDDIVLDLHSVSTTKAAFARALAQPLRSTTAVDGTDPSARQHLIDARQALHDYAHTMHSIREPFGLTLYDLQAEMFAFPAEVQNPHVLPRSTTQRFGREDYHTIAAGVREYAALAMSGGEQSPWARAMLSSNEEASAALDHAHALCDDECTSVDAALRNLAATLGIAAPAAFSGWQPVLALINEVQRVLSAFNPTVFEETAELGSLCEALVRSEQRGTMSSLARSLSGRYRSARRRARGMQRDGIALDDVQLYRGIATARDARAQWLTLAGPAHTPRAVAGFEQLAAAYQTLMVRLSALGAALPDRGLASLSAAQLQTEAAALAGDAIGVYRQPRLRTLERQIEDYQLAPVLEYAREHRLNAEQLVDTIRFTWLRSVYSMLAPELASFDGSLHDQRRADYCKLDAQHMVGAAARVRRAVQQNISTLRQRFPEQVQLVEAQAARTRGHLPSRELIARAPDVVTRSRPCWTMSPLLVAQLLPPQCFDVVVFDEASQILPADAVPALLRAPQAVIAGDTEQLPPTTFFATDTEADIERSESASNASEALFNAGALTSGLESVLDVASALLAPGFLRWHYRSLDERLVGFSNARFYENTLTTFPSPMVLGTSTTLPPCLTHIVIDSEHDAAESAHDEVGRVVELVLEHARTRPEETLGVIAMGIVHADRITEALRKARAAAPDDDELEPFFDDDADERFFIKNLERVQGDERDAIVLSIGYAKSPNGQLSHNFGPLNQSGGERRLNVAITRARRRMTLVSSFTTTDIDLSRTNARGVALLRDYMVYADSSGGAAARGASGVALDPFLEHVRGWLAALSLPVTPMVGQSNYRVDFALSHPSDGSRGLAVECDAQTYSQARTTRDRDRLRPEALQRLGWDVHRVWSAQWYRDPQSEAERIRDAWRTMTGQ
jgi:hypothetical protein